MADKIPIRGGFSGGSLTGLAQFASGDTLGVAHGGTGVVTIGSNALVTGNGTSAITSESNLTFDGTTLATTAFTASGDVSLDGGGFVFNESGADKDFRIEGDTEANLFITDASVDRIGIGTATPSHLVDIEGVAHAATCFVSADLCATTKVVAPALCIGSEYVLPTADGSAGQIMCTDGSGALAFATAASSGADPTSTNTWTADQTFNDNVKVTLGTGGDADLYYDGTNVILNPRVAGSGNVGLNTTSIAGWDSQYFALAIGGSARGVVANTGAVGGGSIFVTNNLYHDGSNWVYSIANEEGNYLGQANGEFYFAIGNSTSHSAGATATLNTALTIDNAGNVGIGTGTPYAPLMVTYTCAETAIRNENMGLWIRNLDTTGGAQVGLQMAIARGGGGYEAAGAIYMYSTGTSSSCDNALGFATRTGDYPTEKMTITGTGYVGIGTTAPDRPLVIKDSNPEMFLVHGTGGGVTGTSIDSYMESSSPANGDFAGQYAVKYKDEAGNGVTVGSLGWFVTNICCSQKTSCMRFITYNSTNYCAAYLSSTGVWTDNSAAAGKEYIGTRQEIWPDGVLSKIKTLNVSKYHAAGEPEDKPITETHVSPTAEDFWDAFDVGVDPYAEVLDKEGNNTNSPVLAAKDLAGLALVGIQELLERIESLETEVSTLKG